ncbi:MarR family winged helix-turn-helix transcriptional regulator [Corynebacterium epidermidicanis]|uniref:Transcriptional regulator n=1 Tax=Corynebacterium epidermidicanis TaxID=1050174 RepID=A0A0G3GQM7_9CORY|nr:MarR family transcriptional regulator [Corynebacterium epidermidicanis]AKK02860.1 transcriptional regulator [Corynebacterium epidermidicanis]
MAAPRWLNDDEQELWRFILAAIRRLERGMDETLQQDSDLSASEFSVLVTLSEAADRRMRLRDICVELEWDRSRASHQITRMERRGLVAKNKCAEDARGVLVELLPEGMKRLETAAPAHVESVRRMVFDKLSTQDVAVFRELLNKLLEIDH